ncbi:Rne/Rng family ribonuclease [Georgenia sp. EYE_87]|uniref:Rne/Rng family ribonuclease n=1 Tax=Georgenia sp. EYE_87 TaxID=2853448 RepID=UPI002006C6F9|nr:Rne/Rng family ribonuclease [Georgenia sp. EYE_87]MCK6211969.1 Rne/Rng family ribonuclease [Georgenia sp. EYE_87]
MDEQNNNEGTTAEQPEAKAAPVRRTRSRRATSPAAAPAVTGAQQPGTSGPGAVPGDAADATTGAPAPEQAEATAAVAEKAAEAAAEKPKRTRKAPARRTTKKATEPAAAEDVAQPDLTTTQEPTADQADAGTTSATVDAAETATAAQPDADAAAEKPKRTRKTPARRTTKKVAEAAATDAATGETATADAAAPAPAPGETAAVEPAAGAATTDATVGAATTGAGTTGTATGEDPASNTATDAATGEAASVDGQPTDEVKPARARRSRRASAPARAPEQKLDVFAELGVVPVAGATEVAADVAAEEDEDEEAPEDAETAATPGAAVEQEPEEGPRLPAAALLFQAPDPTKARPRRRRAQAPTGAPGSRPEGEAAEAPAAVSRDEAAGAQAAEAEPAEDQTADEQISGEDESAGGRRRRRRGGRGRRNRGGQAENGDEREDEAEGDQPAEDQEDAESEVAEDTEQGSEDGETAETEGEEGTSGSRRRRRRRRSGRSETEGTGRTAARDEVTALKGSTRLEAKRQRRREGREAGRRRPTLSEAEFLARREAVDRKMIVREKDGLNQIGVLEDGILVEHYVARHTQTSMVGNVYLGRVQNVLPSMEAAFVDLGKGRNAVLYAGEVNWDAAGMEGQPRRIEQALKSGDSVLVQVTKDPIGHKGARLTSQITLAGRHLVLVPSGAMTGISRKLPDNERARLKKLLKEIVPAGAGVIVRTAAEGATEEQLRADVERLTKQWADIEAKAKSAKSAPVLLKGEPELAVRVVRDVFNEDFESLVVQGDGAWQTISHYVKDLSPDLADRMHHWTSEKDVFAEYRVDEQLAKGMDRKVWLPSGGSLVIDRTEAMTVIDVNTGKFTGSGGTLEETVTRNNIEAAEEIVRQLRLRDIGGIIVIDFIDMVLESNRDLVLRRLLECLGRDRTRHQVAEVTSLGLVQMTRKRVGQGLVEAFSTPCEHCNGRGFIVHDEPVERSAAGESRPPASDDGAPRRRGRRGAPTPVTEAPEEVAAPAEDPAAVAAREAVKATLATIAAAAAHAHEEGGSKDGAHHAAPEGAKAAPEAGKDEPAASAAAAPAPATTSETSGAVPAEQAAPALGVAELGGETVAAEQGAADSTSAAPVAEPAKAGRSRGRRKATSPTTAPAPAAQPATTDGEQRRTVTAPAGPAVSGVIGAFTDGPAVEDAPAAKLPASEPAAPPARRPRRSRRAVSSGVVTPGETKIITIEPGSQSE